MMENQHKFEPLTQRAVYNLHAKTDSALGNILQYVVYILFHWIYPVCE